MKKCLLLSLAAVAACMVLSCEKKTMEQEDTVQYITVTGTLDTAPGTKISIASDGKVAWEAGDELLFHGKWNGGEYSTTVTLAAEDISADKKSFTVTIPSFTTGSNPYEEAGASTMYVAYPASAVVTDNGSTNWRSRTRFSNSNQNLVAGFNDPSNPTSFKLYNLCGVITFSVSGEFDGYDFEGKNGETVGYTDYESKLYMKADASESLNFTYGGSALSKISGTVTPGGTTNYIFLPGGTDFTGGFTIYLKDGGSITHKVSLSDSYAVNVARGKMLPLGDITSHLKAYTPPAEADHVSSIDFASATDLSASGTANSYIVTAPGKYKIELVKGNSSESVGEVNGQELLWETYNTDETVTANSVIAALDRHIDGGTGDRYLVFETPATLKPGNALIAAKDASDNILWSWHIWIPETTISYSTYGDIYTSAIMDRNLGALVATDAANTEADPRSYGMYYQWGRKDPFVAPSTALSGTMTYNAAKMNIAGTIKNPTAYIKTGSDSIKDWNTDSATDLWGASKTIYDPCPPGYVVPTRNKSTVWWGSALAKNLEFNTTYKWFKAGVDYDPLSPSYTGYLVFPICGYIDQGSLQKLGTRVYVWSSYCSSADLAYQTAVDSGALSIAEQRKSRAGNVRCVAE